MTGLDVEKVGENREEMKKMFKDMNLEMIIGFVDTSRDGVSRFNESDLAL